AWDAFGHFHGSITRRASEEEKLLNAPPRRSASPAACVLLGSKFQCIMKRPAVMRHPPVKMMTCTRQSGSAGRSVPEGATSLRRWPVPDRLQGFSGLLRLVVVEETEGLVKDFAEVFDGTLGQYTGTPISFSLDPQTGRTLIRFLLSNTCCIPWVRFGTHTSSSQRRLGPGCAGLLTSSLTTSRSWASSP
ncbi:Uncharacterized protein PODLI_1B040375, partial [Podarcis lilfordi]